MSSGEKGNKSKKLALLRILEILYRESDENHPLTQEQIAEQLKEYFKDDYENDDDIKKLDRKTIGSNVALLREARYKICKNPTGGVYLASRELTDEELRILIDSLQSFRGISSQTVVSLANKLLSLGTKTFRKKTKPLDELDSPDITRNDEDVLKQLNSALAGDRQVLFMYNKYGVDKYYADKKLQPIWGKRALVNPYYILAANNYYYLVGNVDKADNLAHFRLDKITDLTVTESRRKPINQTNASQTSLQKYAVSHPFMSGVEVVKLKARIKKEYIECAIDAFDNNFKIDRTDISYATITADVSENDAFIWALQNANCVEVLEPQPLRDRLYDIADDMSGTYLKNDADRYRVAILQSQNWRGELELSRMAIRDKIVDEDLANISKCIISESDIRNIDFLEDSTRLEVLSIYDCPLFNVDAIGELQTLKELDLRSTYLTSIKFLKGMKLKKLTLACNPVSDYSPLYEMAGLECFITNDITSDDIDMDRLRKTYPGIVISIENELSRDEYYPTEFPRDKYTYPVNLLNTIFGLDYDIRYTAEQMVIGNKREIEETLNAIFAEKFSKEEETVVRYLYSAQYPIEKVADIMGLTPLTIREYERLAIRSLRHPSSSKRLIFALRKTDD